MRQLKNKLYTREITGILNVAGLSAVIYLSNVNSL